MSNDSLTSSVNIAGNGADQVTDGQVAAVREFNRFYTNIIGLLREGHLDTPYSLTEARVLFELAREDAVEAAALRRWLDMDAGYLSRLLARFEAAQEAAQIARVQIEDAAQVQDLGRLGLSHLEQHPGLGQGVGRIQVPLPEQADDVGVEAVKLAHGRHLAVGHRVGGPARPGDNN